jgi:hypothetical protein
MWVARLNGQIVGRSRTEAFAVVALQESIRTGWIPSYPEYLANRTGWAPKRRA